MNPSQGFHGLQVLEVRSCSTSSPRFAWFFSFFKKKLMFSYFLSLFFLVLLCCFLQFSFYEFSPRFLIKIIGFKSYHGFVLFCHFLNWFISTSSFKHFFYFFYFFIFIRLSQSYAHSHGVYELNQFDRVFLIVFFIVSPFNTGLFDEPGWLRSCSSLLFCCYFSINFFIDVILFLFILFRLLVEPMTWVLDFFFTLSFSFISKKIIVWSTTKCV